jgi:hypothetical protein
MDKKLTIKKTDNPVNELIADEELVSIEQITVKYMQEPDSNSSEGLQFLEISTEDAGGGIYFVLKTDRWAFDNIDSLIKVLSDFNKRAIL